MSRPYALALSSLVTVAIYMATAAGIAIGATLADGAGAACGALLGVAFTWRLTYILARLGAE